MVAFGDWLVEPPHEGTRMPEDPYRGSRYLREYCDKAVEHLEGLDHILTDLDHFLAPPRAARFRTGRAGMDT